MRLGACRPYGCLAAIFVAASAANAGSAEGFNYSRDTLSFANWTVFTYENGHIVSHKNQYGHHYSRRCFVMSRPIVQFYKFAQFDSHASPLDDKELAKRIRDVTRKPPLHSTLPPEQRIVFPAYRDLREI